MTAHTCTTLTPGCYRCELNRDEAAAIDAETRADAARAWSEYRATYLLGRPTKDRRQLRRRDFIAGYLAANELSP